MLQMFFWDTLYKYDDDDDDAGYSSKLKLNRC